MVYQESSGNGVMELVLREMKSTTCLAAAVTLFGEFIFCVAEGILCVFAYNHLDKALSEKTPFTEAGAKRIRILGIISLWS